MYQQKPCLAEEERLMQSQSHLSQAGKVAAAASRDQDVGISGLEFSQQ